ncbi:MAG: DUF2065 domain-containing protein [Deltaproteobacteria bacterium]|nr:DUF2065 domain-containing protein [Deltaproteobacteria bacterium]
MDFYYFLNVLGLVLIIEGLPHFLFPKKLKNILSQLASVPSIYLRVFGFTAMTLGLLLLYHARGHISLDP